MKLKDLIMTDQKKTKYPFSSLHDIDIFDVSQIYPSNVKRDSTPETPEIDLVKINPEERRKYYRQKSKESAEQRRIDRAIQRYRAEDSYVKSIERQLVDAKTYLAVKNLDEDFNSFNKQLKERQRAKKENK